MRVLGYYLVCVCFSCHITGRGPANAVAAGHVTGHLSDIAVGSQCHRVWVQCHRVWVATLIFRSFFESSMPRRHVEVEVNQRTKHNWISLKSPRSDYSSRFFPASLVCSCRVWLVTSFRACLVCSFIASSSLCFARSLRYTRAPTNAVLLRFEMKMFCISPQKLWCTSIVGS